VIIFLHIQKTSGSSINEILRSQKGRTFWYKYKGKRKIPDIISGHVPYGIHQSFSYMKKFSYFTFLRHPIERWISQFYHGIERKGSVGDIIFKECNSNLMDFMEWCLANDASHNIITRQLSGLENRKNVKVYPRNPYPGKDFGYCGAFGWFGRHKKATDKNFRSMLAEAKKNLQTFDFVGYLENGFDDQLRLCRCYGFQPPKQEVKKRSTDRKREFDWEDPEIMARLVELNKYDIKLFQFAQAENITGVKSND